MKRFKYIAICALLFALLSNPITILASNISNALYFGTIVISNNSTATTNVATVANISTTNLISGGYLNATANNTVMRNSSGADVPFQPGFTDANLWSMWVPSMGADSYLTYLLYTDNSFDGDLRYFPGAIGMTTNDSAGLEFFGADNWSIVQSGWFDTDAGVNKRFLDKPQALRIDTSSGVDGQIEVAVVGVDTDCLDYVRVNTDWTRVPDAVAFSPTDGAGNDTPFTVIAWVNFDDATSSGLVNKRIEAGNLREWLFDTVAADTMFFRLMDPTSIDWIEVHTVAVTGDEGTWHHYAATYDATELNTGIEIFRDGVNATNARNSGGAYVGVSDTNASLSIGAWNNGANNLMEGQMAEIKIYSAELSQTEIEADFNGEHRTADLVAWWRIDEGNGLPQDSSGNGHDANLNLADWVNTFTERYTVETYASNVDKDERVVEVAKENEPSMSTWATDVNIGVNMGNGILPVKILEEITLDAPAASVTFSGITGNVSLWDSLAGVTSRHLVVMVNAKSPDAVAKRAVEIQFNADAAANYNHQTLTGENAVADADVEAGVNYLFEYPGGTDYPFAIPGTTYANAFGGGTILIPHAFNTTNHKSVIAQGGASEDYVNTVTGRWASTNAITSTVLTLDTGNYDTGSTFLLGVIDERYLVEEAISPAADFVVDFNNIPQDGHDLVVVGFARSDRVDSVEDLVYQEINTDAVVANYDYQFLRGAGAATSANTIPAGNDIGQITTELAGANEFGAFLVTHSQYAESTNQPIFSGLSGMNDAGYSALMLFSGRWENPTAITRLEYFPNIGTNFKAGSLFSLYRVPRYIISRQELTAATPTITFNNIPQEYQALQLNVYARSDDAIPISDEVAITLNTDAVAANYDFQELTGTGAVVAAARNAASQVVMLIPAAGEGANEFGGGTVTFPRYERTDGHKHFITLSGTNENQVILRSSRWENTDAITRIDLDPVNGANFIAGSVFELVGLMPTKVLDIDVDGEIKGIADGNIAVPDTTDDWAFVEAAAMPYMEYHRITINGTLQQSIEWRYNSEFLDLSGNSHNATPSFRTASSDLDVIGNMTAFTPISQAQAPAYALGAVNPFISSTPNITGEFTIVPPAGTFPLAGVITIISNATATPSQLPLLIIAIFVILAASLTTSYTMRKYGSGTLIVKSFVIIGIMGVFIALGDFGIDWWMTIIFAIIAIALMMASRQQSWQ